MQRPRKWRTRAHLALPALASLPLLLNAASPPVATMPFTEQLSVPGGLGVDAGNVGPPAPAADEGLPPEPAPPVTATVSSPKGVRTVAVSWSGANDIPLPALEAYQRAANVLAQAAPECHLRWSLLAGVGRVESDHGRYAGAVLGADGLSRPSIIGVPLNGTGPVAKVRDTDNGKFDHDKVWDRAVGPMQFLPSTWVDAGVDGDGDGVRSPNDINDAALAAGVYLCVDGADLRVPHNIWVALHRYNNSDPYAALVMAYEHSYRTGDYTMVSPGSVAPTTPWLATPGSLEITPPAEIERIRRATGTSTRTARNSTLAPSRQSTAAAPARQPGSDPVTPASDPTAHASDPTAPGSDPTNPAPDPVPALTPATQPQPAPDPSPASDPSHGSDSSHGPDPSHGPDLVTTTGVWEACDVGFCLDGTPLDLGVVDPLTPATAADFDGDGVVEETTAEFAGLVGTTVTLMAATSPTGWLVYKINDCAYRDADGTRAQPTATDRDRPPS